MDTITPPESPASIKGQDSELGYLGQDECPAKDQNGLEETQAQLTASEKERDTLLAQFGSLKAEHATLLSLLGDEQDDNSILREEINRLTGQVVRERQLRQSAESAAQAETEKVNTLRGKLEESRRALMTLQDEAASLRSAGIRRSSTVAARAFSAATDQPAPASRKPSCDLGKSIHPSASTSKLGDKAFRQASLGVGSGTGPRRPSSAPRARPASYAGPVGLGIDLTNDVPVPRRRFSAMMGATIDENEPMPAPQSMLQPKRKISDRAADLSASCPPRSRNNTNLAPHFKLMDEEDPQLMRAQLSRLRTRLTEVTEARDASDSCLKALKAFIASAPSPASSSSEEDATYYSNIKLPPLPTDDSSDHDDEDLGLELRQPKRQTLQSRRQPGSLLSKSTRAGPKSTGQSPALTSFSNGWGRRRASGRL